MTTLNISTSSPLIDIVKPYQLPDSAGELPYYNSTLTIQIAKIQAYISIASNEEGALAADWAKKLQHLIDTNNHYVSHQKSLNKHFSVCFCALTNDVPGLRYLLRTGANPNEMQNGKAPIHIAAAKGLIEMVKILKQSPELNLKIQSRFGKTALQLATNDEVLRILNS